MGVLNRTPDSFSDGGRFVYDGGDDSAAMRRLDELREEGADIVDIGAESTRPGSAPVPAEEQLARLRWIVVEAAQRIPLVSIDTTSPEVAAWALDQGASIVNSVALEPAAELGALCARYGAALVLMHSRGSMAAMPGYSLYDDAAYGDVVADVTREWSAAAQRALDAGLPPSELLLDPGLGFAKNARHSLELCARLDELCNLGFPVLVGPSRKSFVARAAAPGGLDPAAAKVPLAPPEERLGGTIAAVLACIERGASVVRVHDVGQVRQAIAVFEAIERAGAGAGAGAGTGTDTDTGTGTGTGTGTVTGTGTDAMQEGRANA
jgi:dihydropteroate synthase